MKKNFFLYIIVSLMILSPSVKAEATKLQEPSINLDKADEIVIAHNRSYCQRYGSPQYKQNCIKHPYWRNHWRSHKSRAWKMRMHKRKKVYQCRRQYGRWGIRCN